MSYSLTPPTTPDDECQAPQFPCALELVTFDDVYQDIEFRGRKTKDGIKVKVADLRDRFKLSVAYMRTVGMHMSAYSLRDLYIQDYNSITGGRNSCDPSLFSEYAKTHELFISYKGIDILAHNVPRLVSFRDWLDSKIVDLHCYEKNHLEDSETEDMDLHHCYEIEIYDHLEDSEIEIDNHLEDNHLEDNHPEDNHLEDNHLEDNHPEDNHLEDNHLEDNHPEDSAAVDLHCYEKIDYDHLGW